MWPHLDPIDYCNLLARPRFIYQFRKSPTIYGDNTHKRRVLSGAFRCHYSATFQMKTCLRCSAYLLPCVIAFGFIHANMYRVYAGTKHRRFMRGLRAYVVYVDRASLLCLYCIVLVKRTNRSRTTYFPEVSTYVEQYYDLMFICLSISSYCSKYCCSNIFVFESGIKVYNLFSNYSCYNTNHSPFYGYPVQVPLHCLCYISFSWK